MPQRRHINKTTKLAAALLTIVRPDENGRLAPVISREEAKRMTADQIVEVFEFDHVELHALGGSDHPSNLYPRPREEHRTKTAKVDVPAIAKVKRLSKEEEEFRSRILAKEPGKPREKSGRWPTRKMPKRAKK